MWLKGFSLLLFSKIPHLLPKRNHPKRLASIRAAAVCAANRRCVLWSTPEPWFSLCLGSWEWTEPNAGTTTWLEIWWWSHLRHMHLKLSTGGTLHRILKGLSHRCKFVVWFSPKGSIILDPDFDIFQEMGHLCKICKAVSANTQLVKPGGAQCLPSGNICLSDGKGK